MAQPKFGEQRAYKSHKHEQRAQKRARLLRVRESNPATLSAQDKRFLTMMDKKEAQAGHDQGLRQFQIERPARLAALEAAGYQSPDVWDTAHRKESDFAVMHEVDELRGTAGYAVLRQKFAAYADDVLRRGLVLLEQHHPLYAEVLRMRYLESKSQKEIARIYGHDPRTIRRWEAHGRRKLRGYCNDVRDGMALRELPAAQ